MAAPNTVVSPHPLYGGGSSDGSFLGRSTSDTVGFYQDPYALTSSGASTATTTAAQRSGSVQAPVNTTTALSNLTVYAANFSTVSVTSGTSAEQGATTAQMASTSIIGVTKSTATTGVGLIGYRVSATSSLSLNFANVSTTAIVPASTDTYNILEFKAGTGLTTTVVSASSPVAISASTTSEVSFTVPGALPGQLVFVNKPTTQAGLGIGNVRVSAVSTVAVQYVNAATSGAITPTSSETYGFALVPNLSSISPVVMYTVPASVITASTAVSTIVETTTTTMNLLAGDVAISASKPSIQNVLSVANYRIISSSGVLAIAMVAGTTGAVPTTSEAWSVGVFRAPMNAPIQLYSAALNATSVPATTTIEQTTTITGLISGATVWVNKPTHTPSIGIVNARVSAANTLAVQYMNYASTATAVPAETYIVGATGVSSPTPPSASSAAYTMSVDPADAQRVILTNEIRAALVGTNFIAGS